MSLELDGLGGGSNNRPALRYIIWRGEYDVAATYYPYSVVKYNGIAYTLKRTVAISGIIPTNTDSWEVFTDTTVASTIAWAAITGKPTTFDAGTLQGINLSATAPTANQTLRYNSGTLRWEPQSAAVDWTDVASKPSTFTPSAHVHDTADVTAGIFTTSRIPDLDAAKITTGSLAIARGGTALSALGGANTALGVNAAGTALEYKTLTAGTNISISHAANSVTINSTSTGTATSVGLALPSMFTVSNSPVSTSGTLTAVLASQGTGNQIFASPDGATGVPTFRALVAADVPSLDATKITSGVLAIVRGGTGQATANASLNAFLPTQTSNSGKILSTDGTNSSWIAAGGVGTVTSVAMTATAGIFTVAGSPVTASGTFALDFASQATNKFLGSPNGSTGVPTFRVLAAADLPSHSHVKADISDFAHDHNSIYYTKTELNTSGGGGSVHYNNVTNKPSEFDAGTLKTRAMASTAPTDGQVVTWDASGSTWKPSTPVGTGDMLKSTYDTVNNGTVNAARVAPWSGLTGVPSTFTPSAHTHVSTEVTDFVEAVQDVVGAFSTSSASILFTYSDAGNTLTATVKVDGTTIIAGGSSINAANTTALWNADKFQGRNFASTAPTDAQTIVWDNAGSIWKPSSASDPSPAFGTALTDASTVTWATGGAKINNKKVTLAGARTLSITGATDGCQGVLVVKQDATGGRTLALPSGSIVVNTGGSAWTPTATANAVDIIAWIYDGSNYYWTIGKSYT